MENTSSIQLVGVLLFDDVSEAHLELADKRDIYPDSA
jgi:hypothetical protein